MEQKAYDGFGEQDDATTHISMSERRPGKGRGFAPGDEESQRRRKGCVCRSKILERMEEQDPQILEEDGVSGE